METFTNNNTFDNLPDDLYDNVVSEGVYAKIIAMFILGIGALIFGMVPATISERNRRRFPLLISVLLCFGAGVLLSTSLIHILPEAQEQLKNNGEIYFIVGFFTIYLIDEIVHYFLGEEIQHQHENIIRQRSEVLQSERFDHDCCCVYNERRIIRRRLSQHSNYGTTINNTESSTLLGTAVDISNGIIIEPPHTELHQQFDSITTGVLGLLCALVVHSFIEGLVIGVQNTKSKVLVLLTAISCHKYVMGFCLGLEMCSAANSTLKNHIIAILVFSLGSVIGIGAGIILIDLPSSTESALPILQAVAGGTLLYVTVSEIMPREKAKWHNNEVKKYAGIVQFLSVLFGCILMTIISSYVGE